MDLTHTLGTVGFESNVQTYIGTTWQTIIDLEVRRPSGDWRGGWKVGCALDNRRLGHAFGPGRHGQSRRSAVKRQTLSPPPILHRQAHAAALAFNSADSTRPIGTGLDANPSPSTMEAPLPHAELDGVPGVDGGETAAIAFAMLQDACPLVTSLPTSGLSLAEVRGGGTGGRRLARHTAKAPAAPPFPAAAVPRRGGWRPQQGPRWRDPLVRVHG